jgi:hypothetical protein
MVEDYIGSIVWSQPTQIESLWDRCLSQGESQPGLYSLGSLSFFHLFLARSERVAGLTATIADVRIPQARGDEANLEFVHGTVIPNHASILERENDGNKLSAMPGRLESCPFFEQS